LNIELTPRSRAFWAGFESATGCDVSARFYESFHFGDSESLADELAVLVVAGTKRATASLLWSHEADAKPMPKPGDLSIVEKWSGEPVCIIETMSVAMLPFEEVGAEFAATEGEGDGSLEYWRAGHWAYFGRECARLGKEPSASMLVVCESFKVIYRGRAGWLGSSGSTIVVDAAGRPVGQLATVILDYIERNPDAADTVDGISRWWLGPDNSASRDDVLRALETLVAEERLLKCVMPDGRCLFCKRHAA
jgi:uncharacterized protein YhfF